MEKEKKCSNKNHQEIKAINYCFECNLYLCNKCSNYHLELFENHHTTGLDKIANDIFTGICLEPNHRDELVFYCKTHNQLCCGACLSRIKEKGNGQHHDCDVCSIEEIIDEKKNNLNDNIKLLEEFSNNIENSINELKKIFNNINEKKEEIKLNIAKIFTKIRNTINEREDEILLQVEKIYNESFFKEDIIKISEKLPGQIKIALEKGNILNKEWVDDKKKISSKIYDCIFIESNISKIKEIKSNIEKYNSKKLNIQFLPDEDNIKTFLEEIKEFGCLLDTEDTNFKFKFKPGQNYTISKNNSVATKNGGGNNWNCTIFGDKEIPKDKISKWKIKLNSDNKQSWDILIGIGPNNPNNENCFYRKCWSFLCSNSELILLGDSTTKYNKNSGRLKKGDIVEVIVDRKLGNLSFVVNGTDFGIACNKIPKEDILYPTITLYDQNLQVELV